MKKLDQCVKAIYDNRNRQQQGTSVEEISETCGLQIKEVVDVADEARRKGLIKQVPSRDNRSAWVLLPKGKLYAKDLAKKKKGSGTQR